jgi:hypothetical protein
MFACREGAFEARHRRRLRSHALSNLCLSQAGSMPSFQQQVEKHTLAALNAFDFLADAGPAHELGDNLIMSSHV